MPKQRTKRVRTKIDANGTLVDFVGHYWDVCRGGGEEEELRREVES
jgi:hypothetical protein